MHSVVKLLFERLDPVVRSHCHLDLMHSWILVLVVHLIKALFHSGLERVSSLLVSVTVEDAPSIHSRLSEHLGLDLSVQLSCILLDVE